MHVRVFQCTAPLEPGMTWLYYSPLLSLLVGYLLLPLLHCLILLGSLLLLGVEAYAHSTDRGVVLAAKSEGGTNGVRAIVPASMPYACCPLPITDVTHWSECNHHVCANVALALAFPLRFPTCRERMSWLRGWVGSLLV